MVTMHPGQKTVKKLALLFQSSTTLWAAGFFQAAESKTGGNQLGVEVESCAT